MFRYCFMWYIEISVYFSPTSPNSHKYLPYLWQMSLCTNYNCSQILIKKIIIQLSLNGCTFECELNFVEPSNTVPITEWKYKARCRSRISHVGAFYQVCQTNYTKFKIQHGPEWVMKPLWLLNRPMEVKINSIGCPLLHSQRLIVIQVSNMFPPKASKMELLLQISWIFFQITSSVQIFIVFCSWISWIYNQEGSRSRWWPSG